jgi:IrrE N-terminal-like domain
MKVTTANMNNLYTKLRNIGYDSKYVKSLLPDWWDDELAETPAGFQQASLILSQTFGIRAETFLTENSPAFNLPEGIQFKRRDNLEVDDLSIACAAARSLARIVLNVFPDKPQPESYLDASVLRLQLLQGKQWISFQDVLDYSLSIGIPVIHLHHLPKKAKKMDGLAFVLNGRPVIVLTRKYKYGYLLFDLAHELGHISLGHVNANATVIDRKIDLEADEENERAANRFALELLTGNPECKIVPTGRGINGNELASIAERYGKEHQIDPFHIALNYGFNNNRMPVANLAINLISEGLPTNQEILNAALLAALDLDELTEDQNTFLQTHLREV